MKTYYVYILKCRDGSYYVGITNDLERRVKEHTFGCNMECHTYSRRPVRVVYSEEFDDIYDAIAREKQIKRWNRRKKEALIIQDFNSLVLLSSHNNHILRQAQDDKIKQCRS